MQISTRYAAEMLSATFCCYHVSYNMHFQYENKLVFLYKLAQDTLQKC